MSLDSPAARLKWARKHHGKYTTATEAARAFGWPVSTYLGHENGDRVPSRPTAIRYARAYKVRWEWLLEGDGMPTAGALRAQVVGHVGAGAEMYFADGQGPFGDVALPLFMADSTVAAEIRGDSLGPFNGWYAYWSERREPITSDLVGQLCVVGLTDGRVLIKSVAKGRRPRHFDLWGAGGAPLQDQRIEWAAPVIALLSPKLAGRA